MALNPQTDTSLINLNKAVQAVILTTQHNVEKRSRAAYAELDLTNKELQRAHEYFSHNTDLSPSEFWSNTAVLRSSLLSRTVIAIVNESSRKITDQLAKLLSNSEHTERDSTFVSPVSTTVDGIQVDELTPIQTLTHCLDAIYRPVLNYSQIDKVGEVWQSQLSTEAQRIAKESTQDRSSNEFKLAVQLAETTLIVEAPWIYTDRLLAAFELSHKKIQNHTHQTKDALVTVFEKLL